MILPAAKRTMRPTGLFWDCSTVTGAQPSDVQLRGGQWMGWLLLLLVACTESPPAPAKTAATDEKLILEKGSRFPRFGVGQGRLLLSYLMPDASDGSRLLVRELRAGAWTDGKEVASGTEWFVNWADYPSVKPMGDSEFFHYLAYSGEGTYDYDIRFGTGTGASTVLHTDGVSAEHGFLSSAQQPDGSLRVSWLDGRFTKQGGEEVAASTGHAHGGGGAMSLRTALVHSDGSVTDRRELDHRVCDCCNTATVVAGDRTMVVYRDRSEAEIRDIYFVLADRRGEWSAPRPVHDDNWQVTGCPVNGPAVAANARGDIAVAWYTAAEGRPRIQFARYDSLTERFATPLVLAADDPLGRVDIRIAEDGTAYVLGMTTAAQSDQSELMLWRIDDRDAVTAGRVGAMSGARSSGFPRLALSGDSMWIAYTDTEQERVVLIKRPLP